MSLRRFFLVVLMMFCLLALFFAPLATPRHALALSHNANDAITITSQSNSVHFPDSITFNATASDASSTFVSAAIVVNIHNSAGPESHPLTIGNSLRTLRLTWKESTSGDNFLPPGSTVYYYWRFTDKAGDTFEQTMQQLTTIDTRFAWQHLTQGLLQVNWYNRPPDFGQMILDKASGDVQNTGKLLGGKLTLPVNLWVYETDDDFHGSLPPGTYEWVGGIAFPTLNEASIVVSGGSDFTLTRDMPHELTHLVFHQLIRDGENGGEYAPIWFDEGMAVYNQGYHEPDMKNRLNQALATHSLLRLSDISFSFPADADKAYLAYAQSWNLIGYMFSTFGQAKMDRLIKDMDNPQDDFGQDLTLALGLDEVHLENQWRLYLKQPGILTPDQLTPTPQPTAKPKAQVNAASNDNSWILIAFGGLLVIVSLGGLIALFVVTNRRRKQPTIDTGPLNVQPALYSDPALYMRASMYAQPPTPAAPGAPAQMQEYMNFQSPEQAYPASPPMRQYPQE
ncbi:MAG TPA: peptidase MA family metallohydrolase [Ktedonobacteraceae bacterium]|nr:peptidase MA family metallohydrolase [Ktedonobacteraceae bacterium]